MRKNKKILIGSTSFGKFSQKPEAFLLEQGYRVIKNNTGRPLEEGELIRKLKGIEGCITGLDKFTSRVIDSAEELKVISKHGVGVDAIDIDAATRRGIIVTNTPGVNSEAVADLTFGLMLSVARGISRGHSIVTSGKWETVIGRGVYGKSLGILGLGQIGKAVVRRAKGFQMKVLAFDIQPDEEFAKEYGVNFVSLDQLLRESDFLTLHLPLTEKTRGIIGPEELSKMKDSAILINTARGGLVDETALLEALKERKIAGAGIDVYIKEPPVGTPLLELDNVVSTPHMGAYTYEAVFNMDMESAYNLVEALRGAQPQNTVNPEVYGKESARS